jgi:hypothetical protein
MAKGHAKDANAGCLMVPLNRSGTWVSCSDVKEKRNGTRCASTGRGRERVGSGYMMTEGERFRGL